MTSHVPHLTELNTVRQWNEIIRPAVRKRCKTKPLLPQRCSYREAYYVLIARSLSVHFKEECTSFTNFFYTDSDR